MGVVSSCEIASEAGDGVQVVSKFARLACSWWRASVVEHGTFVVGGYRRWNASQSALLSRVIQMILQAVMPARALQLAKRSAVVRRMPSVRQLVFSVLKKVSMLHRLAHHSSFWTACPNDVTSRLLISFQSSGSR